MSVATPWDLFGELFVAVQEAALFGDSKTFADAVPRSPPSDIMERWRRESPRGAAALRAFVDRHFDLPEDAGDRDVTVPGPTDVPLSARIRALWTQFERDPAVPRPGSSELPLPRRYVVPGGRFRELYYWDSYFTMLGLKRSGRQDLVEDMLENFGSLLERFGRIPNGTRSYYLSRSHPPVLHLMARLGEDGSPPARERRLHWMRTEHAFWMAGADALVPGEADRRVVRLRGGGLLNRYWDDLDRPRDESWREDMALAAALPAERRPALWRDLRAAAESGWDFSTRWLGDDAALASIRTTRIVPIDLNCLLLGLEATIAEEAAALRREEVAAEFRSRAAARRSAINAELWNGEGRFYADHDLDLGRPTDAPTAAMAFALFAGVADADRAGATAASLLRLTAPGGLLTTLTRSGQQWDAPNGWAPLQWIALAGLRRYRLDDQARDLASRWLALVERRYVAHGDLLEKYDVVAGGAGGGGEYAVQTGFGWTNGVIEDILCWSW